MKKYLHFGIGMVVGALLIAMAVLFTRLVAEEVVAIITQEIEFINPE